MVKTIDEAYEQIDSLSAGDLSKLLGITRQHAYNLKQRKTKLTQQHLYRLNSFSGHLLSLIKQYGFRRLSPIEALLECEKVLAEIIDTDPIDLTNLNNLAFIKQLTTSGLSFKRSRRTKQ